MPDIPTISPHERLESRRVEWLERVNHLVEQIAEWSRAANWEAERHDKTLTERLLGTYTVPALTVRAPTGELSVNPIALQISGGEGRIDIEAIPTLSRVKLIGTGGGWQVWTDSNVPLRVPWNRESFLQLASDLLA